MDWLRIAISGRLAESALDTTTVHERLTRQVRAAGGVVRDDQPFVGTISFSLGPGWAPRHYRLDVQELGAQRRVALREPALWNAPLNAALMSAVAVGFGWLALAAPGQGTLAPAWFVVFGLLAVLQLGRWRREWVLIRQLQRSLTG